jgi:hypothetical protein
MEIRSCVLSAASAMVLAVGCREAARPVVGTIEPGRRLSVWVPDSAAVLAHEYYSGISGATWTVVDDPQAWAALWDRLYLGQQPQPPLPYVDFGRYRVVVVGLGSRPSGGFDIRIDSVVSYEMGLYVYVVATAPGTNCVTTAAFTAPVQALRLPLTSGSIGFRKRDVVRNCQ